MQKKPSALACDIANPFPPDLWGYVHGFSYWLIYELVMYGKSLSAGPCEVSCIDLAIIVTFFTCRCWSTTTRKGRMYEMYEMYEMYKMYKEVRDRWKVSESVRFSQWSQKPAVSRRSVSLVWQQKHRGACIGSSTPLRTEQHLIPTSLSSDIFNPR